MRAAALLCLGGCSFIAAAGGEYNPKRSTPPSCGTAAVQVLDGAIATAFMIPSVAILADGNGRGPAAAVIGSLTIALAIPFIASTVYGITAHHACTVEVDELAKSK